MNAVGTVIVNLTSSAAALGVAGTTPNTRHPNRMATAMGFNVLWPGEGCLTQSVFIPMVFRQTLVAVYQRLICGVERMTSTANNPLECLQCHEHAHVHTLLVQMERVCRLQGVVALIGQPIV